jgi:hydrogenase/urease accessory protein HupE
MPATAQGFFYGAGFMMATSVLPGTGASLGIAIQRLANSAWIQVAGGAIACCGAYLLLAA